MAELYHNLHIHSCLPPCGDDDMTSANIAGVAAIKGLDVIAVADHNPCRNCPAVMRAAEEYGILVVPGIKINTSEEVHAVRLFPTLERALEFDAYVYEKLMKFPNNEAVFGKQQMYDEENNVCDTEPNLLINATKISSDELWTLAGGYDGVMFLAHIEKSTNSLIANLGLIPLDSQFRTVEMKDLKKLHEVKRANPHLENCRIISNSDVHYPEYTQEPELTFHVEERTVAAATQALLEGQRYKIQKIMAVYHP